MATIISKDPLRMSVEAATGGLVTVLYDDGGNPSFMRRIPKCNIEDLYPDLGLTGTHPAFIVDGVEKNELFIGVYPASVAGNYAVSLPGQDPANMLNFDSAAAYCKAKGVGWHLMTNAEWALLGALGIKTGFQPRGNTSWGLHHEARHETGTLADGASDLGVRNDDLHGRTLTGSGPLSWRHDDSSAGIADLVGNVWEWTGGLRLVNGEIQILKDNDAAGSGAASAPSSAWKAILQNGTLAVPGTADTLKLDAVGSNGTGAVKINKVISSQYPSPDDRTSSACAFTAMTAQTGVTIPAIMKLLSLYPVSVNGPVGHIWHRNAGGSGWRCAAALTLLSSARAFLPFPCLACVLVAAGMWVSVPLLSCSPKPHGHGCADGGDKREPLPPRCKGEHQQPSARPVAPATAVRGEKKKRLQPNWSLEQCWRLQRPPWGVIRNSSGWRCAAAVTTMASARAFLPSI